MLFDLNEAAGRLADTAYDVCVCGTGPAGMTVARKLAARGKRVALIEGGGLEPSEESQDLYEGEARGIAYWGVTACRLRYFGGTSNHWAGQSRPLDPIDFEPTDKFELPGWPIPYDDFIRHLPEASEIVDIAGQSLDDVDAPNWRSPDFRMISVARSAPTRFGEKFGDELRGSDRIDVYLNANAVGLELPQAADRVLGLEVVDAAGRAATVKAGRFVLALGAIENARFLLNCDRQVEGGIGNHSDLLGRCFMEHLDVNLGRFVVSDAGAGVFGNGPFPVQVSASFIREAKVGNGRLALNPDASPRDYGRTRELRRVLRNAVCSSEYLSDASRAFVDFDCPGDGIVTTLCEQSPSRGSRVMLGPDRDRLGHRRVILDWRVNDFDLRSIRTIAVQLGKELARMDLARLQLRAEAMDPSMLGEFGMHCHQMGTTRMAARPVDGVVDPDCKVFGVDNLYLAGGSVFATGGGTNPTLSIVMLALRLGEHLGEAA